jgi:hypothetical protein
VATPGWAPKRKKGESESRYKERYYSAQREHAEETGDQATVDKIYAKAGKKSHSVDSNATDKIALGTVATLAGGGRGRAAVDAAESVGGDLAKRAGSGLARSAGRRSGSASVKNVTQRPALPSSKSALTSAKSLSSAKQLKSGQRALPKGRVTKAEKNAKANAEADKRTNTSRKAAKPGGGGNMPASKRIPKSASSKVETTPKRPSELAKSRKKKAS